MENQTHNKYPLQIDLTVLNRYKKEGWLRSQTHPVLPLTIWNYTNQTQYEEKWDDITMLCRGLVTDDKGNVIAHPLKKFFNYSQLKAWNKVPTGNFKIYEKLDGSLIQLFFYKTGWIVTSKGSFTSPQAELARSLIVDTGFLLDPDKNYIYELTGRKNRIVVDYPYAARLTLIAAIYRDGTECDIESIDDQCAELIDIKESFTWDDFKSFIPDNEEGFIIKFDSGERMKVKGDEYLRLHKIVTQTSSKDIWLALKEDRDLSELIERVPDEWLTWAYKTIGELYVRRRVIVSQVEKDLKYGSVVEGLYYSGLGTTELVLLKSRKDVAEYFKTCQYPSLMFLILDHKVQELEDILWDMVKPEHERAFSI